MFTNFLQLSEILKYFSIEFNIKTAILVVNFSLIYPGMSI